MRRVVEMWKVEMLESGNVDIILNLQNHSSLSKQGILSKLVGFCFPFKALNLA